jgi:hypothetical protein
MADPNIVNSGLSKRITVEGSTYEIEIYRLETNATWILEVVDKEGTSIVWDEQFKTDQDALAEALRTIREEGAAAFREDAKVIPFPPR